MITMVTVWARAKVIADHAVTRASVRTSYTRALVNLHLAVHAGKSCEAHTLRRIQPGLEATGAEISSNTNKTIAAIKQKQWQQQRQRQRQQQQQQQQQQQM